MTPGSAGACGTLAGGTLAGGVLGAALLVGCGVLPREEVPAPIELPTPPRTQLITYPVERTTLELRAYGNARAIPVLQEKMFFRRSGRVVTIAVASGDPVRRGQLLVQLETGELEYQLKVARLDLEIAEKQHLLAVSRRIPQLELSILALQVEKQRLTIENLERQVGELTLRSPLDGLVTFERKIEIGELVPDHEPVLRVADPSELRLELIVSQKDWDLVEVGDQASVRLDRELQAAAMVVGIDSRRVATGTSSSTVYFVRLELLESADQTRPGRVYPGSLVLDRRENVLAIPRAALRESRERSYVRVAEGGARREVFVDVGLQTPTLVEIREGLAEGDVVVGR